MRRPGKIFASQRYRLVLPRMILFSLYLILRVKDVKVTGERGLGICLIVLPGVQQPETSGLSVLPETVYA